TLHDRLANLAHSLAAREERLQTAERAWQVRLTAAGFADEADYLAACLSEESRTALQQQARQLADEQTEWLAREREKRTHWAVEQAKRLTEQSRPELDQTITRLVAEQRALQQAIGGIRQRLSDNARQQQRRHAQIQSLAAQQQECQRWERLHELIGSADGKKYRNFAQGLTFEVMIGYANRQLLKLTDRYLLIRNERQPLDLNVIDSYQGGEMRSTRNLSGGESFVVSLALALGLSHMTSRRVQVDSFFLDEGFGTLDAESLGTALDALAGLHREGKLIGLISHVPAMMERIDTQIRVMPQTGGHSLLSGPGCSRSRADWLAAMESGKR
ncbi:MAG: hypothetical protein H7838_01980, partial [Magnetococcus sp. DMHC-8]